MRAEPTIGGGFGMVSYNARGAGRYVSRSLRAGKDAAACRGARRLIITAPTAPQHHSGRAERGGMVNGEDRSTNNQHD